LAQHTKDSAVILIRSYNKQCKD